MHHDVNRRRSLRTVLQPCRREFLASIRKTRGIVREKQTHLAIRVESLHAVELCELKLQHVPWGLAAVGESIPEAALLIRSQLKTPRKGAT